MSLCFPFSTFSFTSQFYSWSLFNTFYLFSEKGEGREKERERNIDVQEKHQFVASHSPLGPSLQPRHVPWPGFQPADLLVCGITPKALSHTSQGLADFNTCSKIYTVNYCHPIYMLLHITLFKILVIKFRFKHSGITYFYFGGCACQSMVIQCLWGSRCWGSPLLLCFRIFRFFQNLYLPIILSNW